MIEKQPSQKRIVILDVIRGIAVMGIFSVNVVGMAMIQIAYFYPPAFGFESLGDKIMWFMNFLFVDGKMRALFSIVFGASLILVMEAALRTGRNPWVTHYARMIVLLIIGFLHFAVLWWGDILTHYAAVGMVVVLVSKLRAKALFVISIIGLVGFAAPGVYFFQKEIGGYYESQKPDASPELRKKWEERMAGLSPAPQKIAKDRAEHRNIPAHIATVDDPTEPLDLGPLWIETISLMLLGMAGYKSGFLTGKWPDRTYRKIALICFGGGLAAYFGLGIWAWTSGFAPPQFFLANRIISPPLRPIMAMGYAALFILVFRKPSPIRERFAAVGRTAFSNYIGCTLIGTLIFFGFGLDQYARLSRGEAWLLVPPVWILMLLWSKWWLDRFNYGPLEWVWRSLSRAKLQPMRRSPTCRTEIAPA